MIEKKLDAANLYINVKCQNPSCLTTVKMAPGFVNYKMSDEVQQGIVRNLSSQTNTGNTGDPLVLRCGFCGYEFGSEVRLSVLAFHRALIKRHEAVTLSYEESTK